MDSVRAASRALAEARTVPGLLSAARDAFEAVIFLSGEHAESDDGLVAALAGVMAAAADGRDAIAMAPSLPTQPVGGGGGPAAGSGDDGACEIAAALGGLSGLLAARLELGSAAAGDPGDRGACRRAAGYAREARGLLGGTRP